MKPTAYPDQHRARPDRRPEGAGPRRSPTAASPARASMSSKSSRCLPTIRCLRSTTSSSTPHALCWTDEMFRRQRRGRRAGGAGPEAGRGARPASSTGRCSPRRDMASDCSGRGSTSSGQTTRRRTRKSVDNDFARSAARPADNKGRKHMKITRRLLLQTSSAAAAHRHCPAGPRPIGRRTARSRRRRNIPARPSPSSGKRASRPSTR